MKLIYYMHHESHFMCFGKKLADEAEAPNLYKECFIRVNILRKPIYFLLRTAVSALLSPQVHREVRRPTHACTGEEMITVLAKVSLQ